MSLDSSLNSEDALGEGGTAESVEAWLRCDDPHDDQPGPARLGENRLDVLNGDW